MASTTERGLNKYIGTREERVLKKVLERIVCDTAIPLCSNAVLTNCNVLKAPRFSNADVVLQTYMEMFTHDSLESWDLLMQPSLKYTSIYFDQLFKTDLLRQVASEGLEPIKNRQDVEVFRVLLDFFHDLERHQTALESVGTCSDETTVMVVLAEHLFSRLIPGQDYIVNDRSKDLVKLCPCDCRSKIIKGCTAIGSVLTWHGYADIFLCQTIAVSIFKESRNEDHNDDEDDIELEPPPVKKLCPDDNKDQTGLCVEVKNDSVNEKNLMSMRTIDQVIAECITNGFAQVKRRESLSGWLIPTLSCTTEHVMAFLYDPVNDVLLHFIQLFPLWEVSSVNLISVVKIWMLLNFTTFTVHNLSEKYKLEKSAFHQHADCLLEKYKKVDIGCPSHFEYFKTDFYDNIIMPCLLDRGERAPSKLYATRRECLPLKE